VGEDPEEAGIKNQINRIPAFSGRTLGKAGFLIAFLTRLALHFTVDFIDCLSEREKSEESNSFIT
jgi:hypothetical protein